MSDWMAGQPTDDGRHEEERWIDQQVDEERLQSLEAEVAQLRQERDAARQQARQALPWVRYMASLLEDADMEDYAMQDWLAAMEGEGEAHPGIWFDAGEDQGG